MLLSQGLLQEISPAYSSYALQLRTSIWQRTLGFIDFCIKQTLLYLLSLELFYFVIDCVLAVLLYWDVLFDFITERFVCFVFELTQKLFLVMEDIHYLEQQSNKETPKPSTGHLCSSLDRACAPCTESSSLYCKALSLRSLQDTYVIHSLFPLFPVRSNEGLKSQKSLSAQTLFNIIPFKLTLLPHRACFCLVSYNLCKM